MNQVSKNSSLSALINSIFNCLDAHTCALFLNCKKEGLILRDFLTLSDSINEVCLLKQGQGPVAWVMQEQRPLTIPKFKRNSKSLGYYLKDVEIKSFLAVPLPEKAGVLCVDSKTRHYFTEKHQKILHNFAVAIHCLLQSEDVSRENELLLKAIDWLDQDCRDFEDELLKFMDIFSFEICFICRHVPEKDFYFIKGLITKSQDTSLEHLKNKRFKVGTGICGWIFKHQKDMKMFCDERDKQYSFIFEANEDIPGSCFVLGLFYPASSEVLSVEHGLIFTGTQCLIPNKKEVLLAIKNKLGRKAPWH